MFAIVGYPAVKLVEAREKCEQARRLGSEGVNPVQARQLDKIRRINEASNAFIDCQGVVANERLGCNHQITSIYCSTY